MKKTTSVRTIVLLCGVVVLAGGGATYWANGASNQAKARYLALEAAVPDEAELKKSVAESQLVVDDYKGQLQHLEQSVPSLAYVPTLLTELEKLGKDHRIEVTGVRPVIGEKTTKSNDDKKGGEKKAAYQEMSIDINGRGTYADVMSMVDALKKFPKILAVQTVALQPKRATSEKDAAQNNARVLDATVRIKAYLFPMAQAKTGSDRSGETT